VSGEYLGALLKKGRRIVGYGFLPRLSSNRWLCKPPIDCYSVGMTEHSLHQAAIAAFRGEVYAYYFAHRRQFPWRDTSDPYAIWVSEIMLQQTQAPRVVPKYLAFLERFPTVQELAEASPVELLQYWQGLGYNRRALNLQRGAQVVAAEFAGQLPSDEVELQRIPGIGPYTAAAIRAFAFNLPAMVLETNIRRAYLHHFFPGVEGVGDDLLKPLITESQDLSQPREWYWALMDYGSYLGDILPNANRRSKHYTKQSKFEGSHRQVRGAVLKALLVQGSQPAGKLLEMLAVAPERLQLVLAELRQEGFLAGDSGDDIVALRGGPGSMHV
jgi:A/G-specific adenine glycosylase